MLKSALALSMGLLVVATTAQAAVRAPLMEYFTNVQCPPCYSFDGTLITWQTSHLTDTAFINYHMSWPGYDPFYQNNTVDNNARRTAYGVNAIPYIHIDTIEPASYPYTLANMTAAWNLAMIPTCYTEISMSGTLHTGSGGGVLTVDVTTEAGYSAPDARL